MFGPVIDNPSGNLLIVAERPPATSLYGSMEDDVESSADDLDTPTLPTTEWNASL